MLHWGHIISYESSACLPILKKLTPSILPPSPSFPPIRSLPLLTLTWSLRRNQRKKTRAPTRIWEILNLMTSSVLPTRLPVEWSVYISVTTSWKAHLVIYLGCNFNPWWACTARVYCTWLCVLPFIRPAFSPIAYIKTVYQQAQTYTGFILIS